MPALAQEEEEKPPDPEVFDFRARFLSVEEGPLEARLGGQLVVDAIRYGHANSRPDGLELDTLFLIGEAQLEDELALRVEVDLLGVDTRRHLFEAWVGASPHPAFRLRAGQLRIPLSSELSTYREDAPLIGYAFPSYLDGRYDLGVAADGEFARGALWYEASYAFGSGFDLEGRTRESPQVTGRLVGHPLAWTRNLFLEGTFVGLALAYLPEYEDPIVLATPFESTVFLTQDLDGEDSYFTHVEAGWSAGPVRLGFENVIGEVTDVPIGGGQHLDMDQLTAFSWYGSWFLTGETVHWARGRWQGPDPEDPGAGPLSGIGPLELAVRYSNADIDRALFDQGLTTYDPSTQEVRTFSASLNWFPTPGVRTSFSYVQTIADHELSVFGGTNRDRSFVLRLDLSF